MEIVYQCLEAQLELERPVCKDEGCVQSGMECIGYDGSVEYYCAHHSAKHGYCAGCGKADPNIGEFDDEEMFCEDCKDDGDSDYIEAIKDVGL